MVLFFGITLSSTTPLRAQPAALRRAMAAIERYGKTVPQQLKTIIQCARGTAECSQEKINQTRKALGILTAALIALITYGFVAKRKGLRPFGDSKKKEVQEPADSPTEEKEEPTLPTKESEEEYSSEEESEEEEEEVSTAPGKPASIGFGMFSETVKHIKKEEPTTQEPKFPVKTIEQIEQEEKEKKGGETSWRPKWISRKKVEYL